MGRSPSPTATFIRPGLLAVLTICSLFCHGCRATPGLFNFTQTDAFIELDTANFSCSLGTQAPFSFAFNVHVNTNSTMLFTGISGAYTPPKTKGSPTDKFGSTPGDHPVGSEGDPIAFLIYVERPYFRLMLMRLTDHQVRFYLHHAFGYFDKPWMGWHKVEMRLEKKQSAYNPYSSRPRTSRTEITFRVDQKVNTAQMQSGDILWPDWSLLRADALKNKAGQANFYSNEAFLGMPPVGTMSRYAVDTLIEHHGDFHIKLSGEDPIDHVEDGAMVFRPFTGSIKSFHIASDCACGMRNKFGLKMIQMTPGIRTSSVCDARSLPALIENIPASCPSTSNGVMCSCDAYGARATCNCPQNYYCKAAKVQGKQKYIFIYDTCIHAGGEISIMRHLKKYRYSHPKKPSPAYALCFDILTYSSTREFTSTQSSLEYFLKLDIITKL